MARLSIALLGSMVVELDGKEITTLNTHARALLAFLVVETGHAHSRESLAESLWPNSDHEHALISFRRVLNLLRVAIADKVGKFLKDGKRNTTLQFNTASNYTLDAAQFKALLAACDDHPHDHLDRCESCINKMEQAVELYRGNFLRGNFSQALPSEFLLLKNMWFDDWMRERDDEMQQGVDKALTILAYYHARVGALNVARQHIWKRLTVDDSNEDAHAHLMELLVLMGRPDRARAQYRRCLKILEQMDGPGTQPGQELRNLFESIRTGAIGANEIAEKWRLTRPVVIAPAGPRRSRSFLPIPITPLIGRSEDMAKVNIRILSNKVRLVVLTGVTGVGKTRLAQQVALDLQSDFFDGTCWTDLTSIRDKTPMIQAIARALGVREIGDQELWSLLQAHLQPKQMLLVLDGVDNLDASASRILDSLLMAAPELKILATSQAVLGLIGENVYMVHPLDVPNPADRPSLDELKQNAAVALFIQRAQEVKADFALTENNTAAIVRICRRLGGVPLAIILAAAWSDIYAPDELEELFEASTLRHLSKMEDAIALSYRQLAAGEQVLFRRLGVFADGWTQDAADKVCNSPNGIPMFVPDLLQVLVRRNLIALSVRVNSRQAYTMLEIIREFALKKLAESGELATIQRQHAEYFRQFAELAYPQLRGPDQAQWFRSLAQDNLNLQAALDLFREQGDVDLLRLTNALWRFWWVSGDLTAGCRLLVRALKTCQKAEPFLRAETFNAAGILAHAHGDLKQALELCQESLELAEEAKINQHIAAATISIGMISFDQGQQTKGIEFLERGVMLCRSFSDVWLRVWGLCQLGRVIVHRGDLQQAKQLLDESLVLCQNHLSDGWLEARVLNWLGVVAGEQEEYPLAEGYLKKSLELCEELGDRLGIAYVLYSLGKIAYRQRKYLIALEHNERRYTIEQELGNRQGMASALSSLGWIYRAEVEGDSTRKKNYTQAVECLKKSLELYQSQNDKPGMAHVYRRLGCVARNQEDYQLAHQQLGASLRLYEDDKLDDKASIASTLEEFALLAKDQGVLLRAALLLGATDALREANKVYLSPIKRREFERIKAALSDSVDSRSLATAYKRGQDMTLEEIIVYTREAESG